MTAQKGKDMFILDGTGTGATAIAALQTVGLKINNKPIDTTNRDSNGWQELLDGGGITSVQFSGKGVITDGTIFSVLKTRMLDRSLHPYTLDYGSSLSLSGQFQVTSFQADATYDKEQTYTVQLDSSGTIT
jgi:TP901-1 family phage major tail protein